MTARERFLTWTTLATLTCLVLLSFLRPAETRLMADDEAKAEAMQAVAPGDERGWQPHESGH